MTVAEYISRDRPFEWTFQDEMWNTEMVGPRKLTVVSQEQLKRVAAQSPCRRIDRNDWIQIPIFRFRGTFLTDIWLDGNMLFPK